MNSNILYILKKELRETFRDKKSLSMMFVIPLLIPLLIVGMSLLFDSELNKNINEYNKIGFNYKFNDKEKEIIDNLEIDAIYADQDTLKEMYSQNKINLYVTKDGNKYVINGVNNEITAFSKVLVDNYLNSYKNYLQDEYLKNNNIDSNEVLNIINIEENIYEEENFYANYIIVYGFLFVVMAITVSSTYPATDTTAGEKERGTLETLLTFPIKSRDIIIGKYLSVSLSSFMTGLISLILMISSLNFSNIAFGIYRDVNLSLSSTAILFSIIVILSYSLLISGLSIAIASRAKSFKEAQSALTPLTFISFFPSLIAFMINIKSSIILSIIPFVNYTMLFTDITNGNINILNIILMIISTIVFIILVLYINIRQYKSEKILFSR